MTEAMTVTEKAELAELEAVIESGLQTFAEVGNALLAIRDGKKYRAEYGTFEAYCKDRWGFNASRARQLIGAAVIVARLESVTIVTPATESQARPLARLAPKEQPEAWKGATEKAESEGRRVTARDVEEQVNETLEQPIKKGSARMRHVQSCDGMQFANMAIRNMEQINSDDTERDNAFATVKEWINENK